MFNNISAKKVRPILNQYVLTDGLPLTLDLKKSRGSYIYDSLNNRKILDLFSFFATGALGHNHPRMWDDEEFKNDLMLASLSNPSNSDFYTTQYANFLKTFGRIAMPEPFKHAFFISGGTLAVENALKVAMDWKARKNLERGVNNKGGQVIHFKEAFHGRSGYTLSLTNTKQAITKHFSKFDWPRIDNPKLKFPINNEVLENVIRMEKLAIQQIKDSIEQNPNDICAIIIEPIQSEGGDNHFRKEFFKELRKIADENEMMLVFDEVQNGVGLTGKFWAYEHFEVIPDILAFGKKMQVCGIISTARVDEVENNCFHKSSRIGSTWGGNIADMVRATQILKIIEEEKLVDNSESMGDYLLKKISALSGNISNCRGRGLQCAFDLPTEEARDKLLKNALNNNLLLLSAGEKSIRFRPFLDVRKEDIDLAMEILEKTIC